MPAEPRLPGDPLLPSPPSPAATRGFSARPPARGSGGDTRGAPPQLPRDAGGRQKPGLAHLLQLLQLLLEAVILRLQLVVLLLEGELLLQHHQPILRRLDLLVGRLGELPGQPLDLALVVVGALQHLLRSHSPAGSAAPPGRRGSEGAGAAGGRHRHRHRHRRPGDGGGDGDGFGMG